MIFTIKTPKHNVTVEFLYNFIETSRIVVRKDLFEKMCKEGCVNYGRKFSCPPCSLTFNSKKKYLLVILMRVNLNQFDYKDYHKLRVGNAILKPRIEKIMRLLEDKFEEKFYSTGACRLCKKCGKFIGEKCKYPNKMRFSLESTGVDCNKLVEDCFGFKLKWYESKKAPEFTAVVCGIPVDEKLNLDFVDIINT